MSVSLTILLSYLMMSSETNAFRIKFYNMQSQSMKFKVGCRKDNGNYDNHWVTDVTNGLTYYCRFNDGKCDMLHIAVYYYDGWDASWIRLKALNSFDVDDNQWEQKNFGPVDCGYSNLFIINPHNNYMHNYQCIKIKSNHGISGCSGKGFKIAHCDEGSDCPAVSEALFGDRESEGVYEDDDGDYYDDEYDENVFERMLNKIEDPNIHAFFYHLYHDYALLVVLVLAAGIFVCGCLCNRCLSAIQVRARAGAGGVGSIIDNNNKKRVGRYEMLPLSTTDIGGGNGTTTTENHGSLPSVEPSFT
jgi:hypothetical protein